LLVVVAGVKHMELEVVQEVIELLVMDLLLYKAQHKN
jgi:hypothetical protein